MFCYRPGRCAWGGQRVGVRGEERAYDEERRRGGRGRAQDHAGAVDAKGGEDPRGAAAGATAAPEGGQEMNLNLAPVQADL
eukprot:6788047-Pyramimonas_sp.AAC.2